MVSQPPQTGFTLGTELVIITGLSGAGKSTAMRFLEDLGCYCADNLPPSLIPTFFELYTQSGATGPGVAIASDVRSGALFDDFAHTVDQLREQGVDFEILYLDCSTEQLIKRFKEVRRDHPLQTGTTMKTAIEKERARLASIQKLATHVIDTSNLEAVGLRQTLIRNLLGDEESKVIKLEFVSFGYKYGILRDADFVFDVRFLPNPYYDPELRQKTGEQDDVYEYVMAAPLTDRFFEKAVDLIECTLESFVQVGKMRLTIGVGCTGGRHRSVAVARRFSRYFAGQGKRAQVQHRDVTKPQS